MIKKIWIVLLVLLVSVLSSCSARRQLERQYDIELPSTLKEAVTLYLNKIDDILLEEVSTETSEHLLSNDETTYDPDLMIDKSDFMEIYEDNVRDTGDVDLSIYIDTYKTLLEEIESLVVDMDDKASNIELEMDIDQYEDVAANVSFTSDFGLLVDYDTDELAPVYPSKLAYKFGYEEGVFFIKKLLQLSGQKFNYFEFKESQSIVNLAYGKESEYSYKYISLDNYNYFLLEIDDETFSDGGYGLIWNTPEVKIDMGYSNSVGTLAKYSVYNDHGRIFSYEINAYDKVELEFELLEADGWDHAYYDTVSPDNQTVFKDGQALFDKPVVRDFYIKLDPSANIATVSVYISIDKEDITDDILSLSAYGLDFNHPEINMDAITDIQENAYEESKEYSVYRGVDFYGSNIYDQFILTVDEDLL